MMQLNRSGAATQSCLTPLDMVNQSERVLLMPTQLYVSVYSCSNTRTHIMVDGIKPHIIGILESWANNDITDAELGL